ncbi:hypothetical protein NEOLI_001134 [Neolecta irregularis DAH-3]|uniref:Uncharacterized protein n=1 Tax=Neolecta irregularis (strain DAH-3) TaxID=1198029 RepID=A0A1U7LSG5_NEOID|nr:hypothetical protein NEOLI_001134 [Neolecta irregularis DAH-3]|eukprot:OLL25569.1 hypothetical protein NEOLI_001134 [Neolecta irregularis DAH-3]
MLLSNTAQSLVSKPLGRTKLEWSTMTPNLIFVDLLRNVIPEATDNIGVHQGQRGGYDGQNDEQSTQHPYCRVDHLRNLADT